ncbi:MULTISPECIES: general secretion pathway protein GspK [Pseudomonas]|jgi:general secretion pathway protein K|uniref:general secretion pathway protein GspK n=1 Tax=unclassified Pseudomonas TaxID=196821 RepID=UPI000C877749|nr:MULTISPECIES: general secretion pathway protein GspK [unclassified Pseudomonas]PMU89408.1 general secretion pathway protein GspK [Pseudomonas sp. GW704-F3]PMU93600.1 general secretion pathway protein GspK [Pseudomonas sp. GW704-F5]PMV03515.1 general secretion pathway protein GspK [Pseudomonas sp. MPBD4-3]PMV27860.1 general secretion pathway protein GspK [Pseudomonas sp. GW704-F2]
MRRQRGAALLLVLWVLALLSVLLGGLAGWVQLESRQALWHRQHTQTVLAAQAGVALAMADRHWIADGRERLLTFDDAQLHVSLRSERGKLYLVNAEAHDLTRLALACGASPAQATQVAKALDARRKQGLAPFRVLEEVRQLPGMSQALYRQLLPELTLWSDLDRPAPAFASALMRQALNLPQQSAQGADPGEVLVVDSRAQRPGGYEARLQVTVLLSPMEDGAQPYRVLRWQE